MYLYFSLPDPNPSTSHSFFQLLIINILVLYLTTYAYICHTCLCVHFHVFFPLLDWNFTVHISFVNFSLYFIYLIILAGYRISLIILFMRYLHPSQK